MGGTWECMVGWWPDPDAEEAEMTRVSTTATSWAEARRWMLDRLAEFVDDDCPDCRQDGVQAIVHLVTERPGRSRWHAEIDGDDYWIVYRQAAAPDDEIIPMGEPILVDNGIVLHASGVVKIPLFTDPDTDID